MIIYDRYTQKEIAENELPEHIDLGRFTIDAKELTNSLFSTNKVIHQELLLDNNKSIQDIFLDIYIEVEEKSKNNEFNVIPLIRRIKNKLYLNEFEKLLEKEIFHIEEIFRQPHYLLERQIEKVNVSRAKRIPSKSYQYLASHTEDWLQKSIVCFKPSRILNEELELNFDIYENQLTVAFVDNTLKYLSSRIKEIQDLKSFLILYNKLLEDKNFEKGWYKKIERNLKLVGFSYEDENYHCQENDRTILTETEQTLHDLNKRLSILRKIELYKEVNKRICQNIKLQNTNVIVNHKHYRFVKTLWIEIEKIKPEKSEEEKQLNEQNIIKGVTAYAISLLSYCLKEYFNYEIIGNYKSFNCNHSHYPNIEFKKQADGILSLRIGKNDINILVLSSDVKHSNYDTSNLKQNSTFVIYYSESPDNENNRMISINPLSPDATEKIGALIKKYLLKEFFEKIERIKENQYFFEKKQKFEYDKMLGSYFDILFKKYKWIKKNEGFKYEIIDYPIEQIDEQEIVTSINNFEISDNQKKQLITVIKILIKKIQSDTKYLKKEIIYCMNDNCFAGITNISNSNFVHCKNCNTIIETKINNVELKIKDEQLINLQPDDWGMDYLNYNINDL